MTAVNWQDTELERAHKAKLHVHTLATEWGTFYATVESAKLQNGRGQEILGSIWADHGHTFTLNAQDYRLRTGSYTFYLSTRDINPDPKSYMGYIDVPAHPYADVRGLTRGEHSDPTPKARRKFDMAIGALMAKHHWFKKAPEAERNARELLAQKQEEVSERHVTRATSHLDQAERHLANAARIRAGDTLTDWDLREIGNCSV